MRVPNSENLQISATYLRILAREHADPSGILAELGVEDSVASDSETVSVSDFFALVRAVDECHSDRAWHLEYAHRTADHFHGPLTFAMMSAPTIGEGLGAIGRYMSIRASYLRSGTSRTGRDFSIELIESQDLGDIRHLLLEITFRILHDYVAMIGDVNLAAATLSLTYPAGEDRAYYDKGFNCRVLFDQDANVLTMPAAWMAIPNPQHEQSTWTNAIAQCEVALSELDQEDAVARTRSFINATMIREPASLCIDDAAKFMGMSTRTLIRRLGNDGTSFQELRDSARQDLALRLLRKPNLTVESIAAATGFSDAANFSRAFKRWFGASPRRYRRERTG
jgi:AraC-like DNA-binding protein